MFDFFTDNDTTYGGVNFVGGEEAKAIKLISTQDNGIAVLGVDVRSFLQPDPNRESWVLFLYAIYPWSLELESRGE